MRQQLGYDRESRSLSCLFGRRARGSLIGARVAGPMWARISRLCRCCRSRPCCAPARRECPLAGLHRPSPANARAAELRWVRRRQAEECSCGPLMRRDRRASGTRVVTPRSLFAWDPWPSSEWKAVRKGEARGSPGSRQWTTGNERGSGSRTRQRLATDCIGRSDPTRSDRSRATPALRSPTMARSSARCARRTTASCGWTR